MLISAVDFTFVVTVQFSEYVCKTNWLINWFFPLYKNCFLRNFLMFFKVIDGSYLYKNSCPMSRKRSTAMLLLKNNAIKTLKKCNFGKFLCLHREAKINMESFFKKSKRRIFFKKNTFILLFLEYSMTLHFDFWLYIFLGLGIIRE